MQTMGQNGSVFYYSTLSSYTDKTVDGLKTGEKVKVYANPIKCRGNISAARGNAYIDQFGVDKKYNKTIIVSDTNLPIDENTILWIDKVPNIVTGFEETANYKVESIAKSINYTTYAIKEMN